MLKRDDGQVMLLILTYVLISTVLVLVAIDAADLFLNRRQLASLADGAALAAAQAVDRAALYTGGGCTLPIDGARAQADVANYLAGVRDTDLVSVSVGADRTVTVVVGRRVDLPLRGLLGVIDPRWSAGVPVAVAASARSPYLPASC